jgi:hypothetical protein
MMIDVKMFEEACKIYGECIGVTGCLENTKDELMAVFGLNEIEAKELAKKAFDEWVEAYS